MSCVSTPTATQYSTLVSSSVSTSFSQQVTSLPDTTSTILSTSCLSSAGISLSGSSGAGVGTCVSSTVVTSTTVINGGVSTTQVPFEITNAFTSSIPTNTLFAPCTTQGTTTTTTSPTTSPTTTTTSTPTTTSAQFSTQFSQSQTTVFTTPTTTFTSSQESTLGDGQITQIIVTLTSALPPTSAVLSSSVPIATTQVNDNSSGNNGSLALGAIIGGSVGGFFGLLAIVAAVWFYRRRRTNFDDIFEKDYEEYTGGKPLAPKRGRMLDLEDDVLEANTQPKPYVYGLVGAPMGNSPPSLNAGLAPAAAESRPSLTTHTRSSSMTPLVVNNNAPGSRPVSIAGGSHAPHSGGRSGSPGPLGVQIPTGPAFAAPLAAGGESPTSILPPRGPLFVANATDPWSPPGSPALRSSVTPTISNDKRSSLNNVAGPSVASPTGFGAPPGAFAYLAERQQQNLQRDNTVSSASVYSQPSRAPTPPPIKVLGAGSRRTSAGVVVHTDGGRVTQPQDQPPDQPPAYQD